MSVTRWRSSMVLLGICVVAVLIGALRLATQQAQQPSGSSLSSAADGALAVYTWMTELGAQTRRLTTRAADPDVSSLIVLEPGVYDPDSRSELGGVADRGGTIVLAGDSLQWVIMTRQLGVTVEPAAASQAAVTPDGLSVPLAARYRLRADNAEPLLLAEDGTWLALRKPYRQGALVVIASPRPLTNAGLRDDATARFVFREIVSPTVGQQVAFDEVERIPASSDLSAETLDHLLFQTPAGLAIVYAALLTFAFLFLAGRRLGPALVPRSAAESQRTMYEHVEMLAGLYRRADQLTVVREAFRRHYARQLSQTANARRSAKAFEALQRIESARSESDLISAVAGVDDAG